MKCAFGHQAKIVAHIEKLYRKIQDKFPVIRLSPF